MFPQRDADRLRIQHPTRGEAPLFFPGMAVSYFFCPQRGDASSKIYSSPTRGYLAPSRKCTSLKPPLHTSRFVTPLLPCVGVFDCLSAVFVCVCVSQEVNMTHLLGKGKWNRREPSLPRESWQRDEE